MDLTLSPLKLRRLAESWLEEDQPSFDFGALVVGDVPYEAKLLSKQQCILAGKPFFDAIFNVLGCNVEWRVQEGSPINQVPQAVAIVRGPARLILLGERSALNCLSRCSGVATQTRRFLDLCHKKVACTRKTTPGFRLVEKYGAAVGGADPHRFDLSSMAMLKDNHVTACGGMISQAITKVKNMAGFSYKVEVEARNEDEALKAAEGGADVVMLDNFDPENAKLTARSIKLLHPHTKIEISGGVNAENIAQYCSEDVDVISLGLLTQGYPCIDFSLKFLDGPSDS